MININHLLKVTAAWISIVWTICFFLVGMMPGVRPSFMMYGWHTMMNFGENIFNFSAFIYGLILWNIIALAAVGLFAWLYNNIKK